MSANVDCARLFKAELGAVLFDVGFLIEILAAGGGDGSLTLEQAMQGLFGHVDELRTAARQRAASLTPGDRTKVDAWLVEFLTACNGIKREAKAGRLLADDVESLRRLAGQGVDRAEAVVECCESAAAEPQPSIGWEFTPGLFSVNGKGPFPLTGTHWRILKKLATPNRRFTWEELRDASRGEDSPTGKKSIGSHLSALRTALCRQLGLGENIDPIPSEGRGGDLVYWLDLANVKRPSKKPSAKKSRNKPKLSRRKARR